MYPIYESELSFWGLDKEQGGMFSSAIDEPETLDEMMERYNKRLAELESLRKAEPKKKRSRTSKFDYIYWIHRTHDLRDELNDLAEAIREKQQG